MQLLALLQLVALVSVDEGETIATGPQLSQSISAGPVLVTAMEVRGEVVAGPSMAAYLYR